MGSPGGDGGGWPPDGGAPDDLPRLPPEWGHIVVPDDASALAAEAAAVRDELRRRHRQDQPRQAPGPAGLRASLLIMSLAVLVTLASFLTAAWPGLSRPVTVQRTAGSAPGRDLPALELVAADGQVVAVRSMLPAVILLVDGCRCDALVADTAAAARPDVTVVTVTTRQPSAAPATSAAPPAANRPPATGTGAGTPGTATPVVPPAGAAAVTRRLLDPAAELRHSFALPVPDGTASALVVARDGAIVRTVPRTVSLDDFRPDLARL
jgi:hypothetical protein